jgi:hypothetical protein
MDQLLREQMRVFTEAENALAEMLDPEDTRTVRELAHENRDALIDLYQEMCSKDVVVQSLLRKQRYDKLKGLLLEAVTDCEERGHDKGVIDRFHGAIAVCDRAADRPRH